MNGEGTRAWQRQKRVASKSLSRQRGGEQVRAGGGEDHAELHCIPDRPSALRVGRLALFARHLLSADASRARAEQRNATQREVKARQSKARGQRGAAKGRSTARVSRASSLASGSRNASCTCAAPPPSCVSVRKSSRVGFGWQLTAGGFARLAVPVPSCPHLFANASDASARRCALAVFEAGQPDSELEPSRGSQKKPSLVLRPLGPFVVALSAVRDKDSADPPCALGTALHIAAGVGVVGHAACYFRGAARPPLHSGSLPCSLLAPRTQLPAFFFSPCSTELFLFHFAAVTRSAPCRSASLVATTWPAPDRHSAFERESALHSTAYAASGVSFRPSYQRRTIGAPTTLHSDTSASST